MGLEKRRSLAAGLVLVLALGLSACDTDDDPGVDNGDVENTTTTLIVPTTLPGTTTTP